MDAATPVCVHCGYADPHLKAYEPCRRCGAIYEPLRIPDSYDSVPDSADSRLDEDDSLPEEDEGTSGHPFATISFCLVASLAFTGLQYIWSPRGWNNPWFWKAAVISVICIGLFITISFDYLVKRSRRRLSEPPVRDEPVVVRGSNRDPRTGRWER